MDLVSIDGLELRCIVGIRSYERHREQPVRLDLELGLDLSEASRTGRIAHSADYSWVADATRTLLRFRQYRLLEVAAHEVVALLFAAYPILEQVRVRIEKPEALTGRARAAAVALTRPRAAFPTQLVEESFGRRFVVLENEETTIERIEVPAGGSVTFADPCARLEWRLGEKTEAPPAVEPAAAEMVTSHRADREPLVLVRCLAARRSGAPHS